MHFVRRKSFFSVSKSQLTKEVQHWKVNERIFLRRKSPGQTQAKKLINFSLNTNKSLRDLRKRGLRTLTDLLALHNTISKRWAKQINAYVDRVNYRICWAYTLYLRSTTLAKISAFREAIFASAATKATTSKSILGSSSLRILDCKGTNETG